MHNNKFDVSEELNEFFDFIHPAIAREVLWQWFKVTVAGNFATEVEPNDKTVIINLYEKIDKVLKAAEKSYKCRAMIEKELCNE